VNQTLGYAVGAVGVVRFNDQVLMVLSRDRGWEPPGGWSNPMEPLVDAVSREVLEETGYVVEPTQLTGVYQCTRERPILSFVFLCRPVEHRGGDIEESLAIRWCPETELDALVTYEPHRLRLHDALTRDGSIRMAQYTVSPFSVDHARSLNATAGPSPDA
jgi:8-oxo-dGTP diphosphatase